MKVIFQADADFNQVIVTGTIRYEPKINFKTAQEGKLEGLTDLEVLEKAASENRILVTHDRKTMPHYFGDFITSQTSAGVIVISQNISIKEAIDSLVLIWEISTPSDWINQIMSIPF